MKIAMIGQKRVPSRLGGIEVAVEALALRMAAAGHEVTLYNSIRHGSKKVEKKQPEDPAWSRIRIRNIPVPDVKGLSTFAGSLMATVMALFGRYDCIHFHAEGPAAMAFLPKMLGIRTVVTIHGLDWKRSKWSGFATWYLKRGEKTAVSCADEIIVLSEAMKRYFLEEYGRETVLIPNGIERPVRREAKRIDRLWHLKKDGYILYLGRIVPEKGIEYLIRAYRKVRTEKKLVIAGGISDTKAYFEKLMKLSEGDDRIFFTGFVQGEILDELYSNSYLYCLPSEVEGMPISLLEAMSYGNCCLCSDIPECSEVTGSCGYLFRSGDVSDLRRQLQILCSSPEAVSRTGRQADHFVFDRYNWDDVTEKTLALYRGNRMTEKPESGKIGQGRPS